MKDKIYKKKIETVQKFEFNKEVSKVFQDMIQRSVPFYQEISRMSAELCNQFYIPESGIYDLGCSLGILAFNLVNEMPKKTFKYFGVDSSAEMLKKAQSIVLKNKIFKKNKQEIYFVNEDISNCKYENPSCIVSNFSLQFINPLNRFDTIQRIQTSLLPKGIFILSEKIIENNEQVSVIFQNLHHNFKKRNSYSDLEIAQKREALDNVLIPFTSADYIELLNKAGFEKIHIFFKWYNFISILAIKE